MGFRVPSIHQNSRALMFFAGLVGAFPVTNVYSFNIQRMKYKVFSIKTAYSYILLICCMFIEYHALVFAVTNFTIPSLREKGIKHVTAGAVFYGSTILSQMHYIGLAKKWPDILRKWSEMEQIFLGRASRRLTCHAAFYFQFSLLFLSIIEHLIHNWVHFRRYASTTIHNDYNGNVVLQYLEGFTRETHDYVILSNDGYNHFLGVIIVVCSFNSTVIWTLNNVFIWTVSMELTQFVRAFQKILKRKKFSWKHKRLNYRVMANFISETNGQLKEIVGFSLLNDVYFICVQLYQFIGSKYEANSLQASFYGFSFLFFILRACCSLVATAQVHSDWLTLSKLVYASQSNSPEVERFALELFSEPLALTYFNFGNITRATIMSVVGTIVSYEIILLQMHGESNR